MEFVDLGGQNEIALRQTVDLVCPGGDLDFSPSKEDVWVVPLLLRKLTNAMHKLEGFAKVGKLEDPRDVVFFDDVPPVDLKTIETAVAKSIRQPVSPDRRKDLLRYLVC